MSEFNLIPADYAKEQAVRRRLRWALLSFAVLCGFVVLARVAVGTLVAIEKDKVAQLQVKKRLWQESKAKTERYLEEARTTERQLAALDDLRARDHLRLFLEALDTAYVNKVWFDEIRYYRHEIAPAPPPQPKVAQSAIPRVEQRVGMVGHATNHIMLAEFMRKLENQAAIADLALVDTRPRSYPGALVIDFKLGLLVDRKAKGVR